MKYSLSSRILETKELTENIKNGIRPGFGEFASLAADCGFDGVNLRPWQTDIAAVSDAQILEIKKILEDKNLEVFVMCGAVTEAFVERATILGAKTIQAAPVPESLALIDDSVPVAMQMHTGGDFETVSDCVESFAGKYSDPQAMIFPEPGNLQLVGETFAEDMFLSIKDRIAGWFFQSLETGVGEMSIGIKSGERVSCRRVEAWKNTQLDMALFARAIKKCGAGEFFNINEPPPKNHENKGFLTETLNFIKENLEA